MSPDQVSESRISLGREADQQSADSQTDQEPGEGRPPVVAHRHRPEWGSGGRLWARAGQGPKRVDETPWREHRATNILVLDLTHLDWLVTGGEEQRKDRLVQAVGVTGFADHPFRGN